MLGEDPNPGREEEPRGGGRQQPGTQTPHRENDKSLGIDRATSCHIREGLEPPKPEQ